MNFDDDELLNSLRKLGEDIMNSIENETLTEPKKFSERQVIAAEDFEIGRVYQRYGEQGMVKHEKILVLDYPRYLDGLYRVEAISWPLENYSTSKFAYLSDMGIVAYDNGRWNPANYVEPTEETVSLEEVTTIRKKYRGDRDLFI